jgi:CheY-like chemotaxis protein
MNTEKTILIVEDEPGFRRTYVDLFSYYGHKVVEAEDGEKGLEILHQNRPDLVLLDLMMPGINGYDVLKKIRADKKLQDVPVIIFSVLGEQNDIQKALDLGANDYITKGFYSPQEVLKKIGPYLASADIGYEK